MTSILFGIGGGALAAYGIVLREKRRRVKGSSLFEEADQESQSQGNMCLAIGALFILVALVG